ncbi:hypothetical protein QQ020_00050 [Fulvivirgaceae bacterium BMA12]|uniref:Uncharacterized protein n=1 Tax=Agaribacillus aureus TaxID=3051825 RepID=A0ABT8KY94_9BACT|nr:hypothetical protein [Fulvivirgaceae bacterium BMA12]
MKNQLAGLHLDFIARCNSLLRELYWPGLHFHLWQVEWKDNTLTLCEAELSGIARSVNRRRVKQPHVPFPNYLHNQNSK